jgi:hypothetical protein
VLLEEGIEHCIDRSSGSDPARPTLFRRTIAGRDLTGQSLCQLTGLIRGDGSVMAERVPTLTTGDRSV